MKKLEDKIKKSVLSSLPLCFHHVSPGHWTQVRLGSKQLCPLSHLSSALCPLTTLSHHIPSCTTQSHVAVIPAPSISHTLLDPRASGAHLGVVSSPVMEGWEDKDSVSQELNKKIALGGNTHEIPLIKPWGSELVIISPLSASECQSWNNREEQTARLFPDTLPGTNHFSSYPHSNVAVPSPVSCINGTHWSLTPGQVASWDTDTNTTELPWSLRFSWDRKWIEKCPEKWTRDSEGWPGPLRILLSDQNEASESEAGGGDGEAGRESMCKGQESYLYYPSPLQTLSYSSPTSCLPSGGPQALEVCQAPVLQ